ncbi:MAG: cytidylyltransferase domain-containing protein, partial [Candidatus Planktophila sp.]
MKVLALIPARGGSKGLPRKNVLEVGGHPLIAWTISAAKKSKYVSDVIVSTDDEEIKSVSLRYGAKVPFLRPVDLSSDTAKSIDVALHALQFFQNEAYDLLVFLQPTSPLRTAQDIDEAIEQMVTKGAASCVSICEVQQSPYLMYTIGADGGLNSILPATGWTRRQDFPAVYALNGAIYVSLCQRLLSARSFFDDATVGHIMPFMRSVDIDTADDLASID